MKKPDNPFAPRAICLNCIDGRVQMPVIRWIQRHAGVELIDMITEPGMDGLLSNKTNDIQPVFRKIEISVKNNNSQWIYIVAHHDCRGNPVSEEEHRREVAEAVTRVRERFDKLPVIGLWVGASWEVELVAQKGLDGA